MRLAQQTPDIRILQCHTLLYDEPTANTLRILDLLPVFVHMSSGNEHDFQIDWSAI